MEIDNFFCKIFLKIEKDKTKDIFLQKISEVLDGDFDKFLFLENELLTIELRENKEYDRSKMEDEVDGFLFYPFFLEVDLKDEDNMVKYFSKIIEILKILNDLHVTYVSACDFEDELPKSIQLNS